MTALVLDPGVSAELAFGAAGAGLDISPRSESWAKLELGKIPHAAASAAYNNTLILTPNLPLLTFLETVCAVHRNAVLIVIAQEYIGVLGCALITDAECDMGCYLISESDCAAEALKMLGDRAAGFF